MLRRLLLTLASVSLACESDSGTPAAADVAQTSDLATTDVAEADVAEADVEQPSDTAAPDDAPDGLVGDDALTEPDAGGEPGCDPSRPPLVLVHGLLAAGDMWAPHAMRFMANGWCRSHLYAFDWDTVATMGGSAEDSVPLLDDAVDAVLASTGATQVVLLGHSAGGGLGYLYLEDAARSKKISKYVHIGSNQKATLPGGGVPTLNLWSAGDKVITNKGDIDGATNVKLATEDHLSVATSAASFRAIYAFVAGEAAATDAIVPTASATVEGRAIAFGPNTPAAGATLDVWEVDPATGARLGAAPVHTVKLGAEARFGPLDVTAGGSYEFMVSGGEDRPVHYYKEPIVRSNPFVYLRTLPGADSGLAGALLASVPFTADQSTLVAYGSSHAFIFGERSLALDGKELLTAELASPAKTLIGLFLYDGPSTEEGAVIDLMAGFPFLNARDTSLPAPGASVFNLDGRTIAVQRVPGDPDGAVIAAFD